MIRFSLLIAGFFVASTSIAENWPQWRGPHFNGSSSEKNLPTEWSKTENIAWTVDMPGPSASTPIIWGDRVFLSTTDSAAKTLLAMCLDRRTGKPLWSETVTDGYQKDNRSNYSSPSP